MTPSSLSIPYVDLAGQHCPLKAELLAAVGRVIDSGQFILGEQVAEFERQFAQFCGVRYAVGLNSGTDALLFALRALGIGPGDEVITVPNSFVSTASVIQLAGARAVFVDVLDNYTLDPSRLEGALTPATRAVLPVHLTGHPCAMAAIGDFARAHGLHVIEDAAQAVGASYRGQRVGAFGAFGCFSLHPLKTLNACGDGGVVTTNDPAMADRLRIMRNLGLKTRDDCVEWAPNSRLDTLQAAMLLVKLRHLEEWTERRRANAAYYRAHLQDLPYVKVPSETPDEYAVYHTFVIQADRRDALKQHLAAHGIGTAIHYPVPIHLSNAGRSLGYPEGVFPVAERQARRILSLPVYPELTPEQLDRVCECIRGFYSNE